ncbi:DNA cytosine methyltransferase [Paenarthrobacter sp. YJN-D]|uniref:DNA cytosine methyltransferase n=1 Tax=Paenarthrobacter sp. YJN-D TaxID=2735317 RepID=UPI0018785D16|nr:DNA (cytosine-5-)-methyltransferase [Paenarthrobacter sp. YJN-D]QOT21783.1 DNA (cytosine-5-)-methyltransferase [Paenarthrobacter sp. YJN-D]
MHQDTPILSLFAGIGGFEEAFRRAGFSGKVTAYENWPSAQMVLSQRFPSSDQFEDVKDLPSTLHDADLVTAGFPCTDLSPAGLQAGIDGHASGLILDVLRAVQINKPEWVLLENVPNMLRLKGGEAMAIIGEMLTTAGYRWCYRTLDAQYFGVAQRRKRVFLLASRNHEPERIMFRDYAKSSTSVSPPKSVVAKANGFYWTEGNRGLGWGSGVVPTIKGSTTAGIPSAPAIWLPGQLTELKFRTPSIEALESLQGFRPGWTRAAPQRDRWKLVGNAVAVPVVKWIAQGLREYEDLAPITAPVGLATKHTWGLAGISIGGNTQAFSASEGPTTGQLPRTFSLHRLLQERGSNPLSVKATRGFCSRLERSTLRYDLSFMSDLKAYAAL